MLVAVFTPLHADGSLNLAAPGPIVDHLLADGVQGLFVCGTKSAWGQYWPLKIIQLDNLMAQGIKRGLNPAFQG
ncbi:dihydrodipicolinate synthase family protein [Chloroflexota bacterium]